MTKEQKEFSKRLIIEEIKQFCDLYRKNEGIGEGGLDEIADNILSFSKNYIHKDKIRNLIDNNQDDIDYSIHDIIEDLKKILEED